MGRFWQQFRHWERTAQAAFGLALTLLIVCALVAGWGPSQLRTPALIGGFGLVVSAQLIFMWANRGMVTPYTQAQQRYLAEDFEGACMILERQRETGRADVRTLTLLGNAYRQRGLLDESAVVLLEALNIQPNHHFPLYGFGRTLLIQGLYEESAGMIEKALAAGAPAVVRLDAGEAYFRCGQHGEAARLIKSALPQTDEPHRRLMGQYLLYRMGAEMPPEQAVIRAGLPYWQAHAERYQDTVYGQDLTADVRAMQMMDEKL